jgi:P27 family predicted phage terminase small subunit
VYYPGSNKKSGGEQVSTRPKAPAHLSLATRKWWRQVVEEYQLETHHLKVLQAACEAWDRLQEARERVGVDGAIISDRFGQLRPHPAIAIERDSRIAFARLVRELCLDDDGPETPRPPRAR